VVDSASLRDHAGAKPVQGVLHELQRIQAMRLGVECAALPVAVDIQTDGKDY